MMSLLFTANTFAGDLGYRFDANTLSCVNSSGNKGYNPDYLGQCGKVHDVHIVHAYHPADPNAVIADLDNKDLRGISFEHVAFIDGTLQHADLTGATFKTVNFLRTSFQSANLSSALLEKIGATADLNFNNAILDNAVIKASYLNEATFIEASLIGTTITALTKIKSLERADLRSANLSGMSGAPSFKLKEAKFDINTQLPSGFTKDQAISSGMIFVE